MKSVDLVYIQSIDPNKIVTFYENDRLYDI